MSDSESVVDCVLAFDTDEPEFTRGVEIGMTWAALSATSDGLSLQMRSSNVEMALRIAEALDRPFLAEEIAEDWLLVHFGPAA